MWKQHYDWHCDCSATATMFKAGENIYNPEAYVGNWYEETVRNTLKRNEFLKKRECGDLKIQRTQTMADLLLKPVELSQEFDACLHFGDQVQIVSPGPTCKTAIEVYPFKRNYCKLAHLALSAAVPPEEIDHAPYLSTTSLISASPLLYPVVRNSFIIENPTCPSDTGVVNYGDVFRIKAFTTQHFQLYLFAAPGIRLHSLATHSAKPKVRFSDLATADTLWTTCPMDEETKMRMELGVPVRLKTPLLLKHNGSGHNLSTEPGFPIFTYFGEELEVTLDSKLDRVKCPRFENIWYFDTDRSNARNRDPCDEDFEKQAEFSAKINANTATRSAAQVSKEEAEFQKANEDDGEENNDDIRRELNIPNQYETEQMDFKDLQSANVQNQVTEALGNLGIDKLPRFDPISCTPLNIWNYRDNDDASSAPLANRKWTCGECPPASCCPHVPALKPKPAPQVKCCATCTCVEPEPRMESPNALACSPLRRLLQ